MTTSIRPCKESSAAGLATWPALGKGIGGAWQEEAGGQTNRGAKRQGRTGRTRPSRQAGRHGDAPGWALEPCAHRDLAYTTILSSSLLARRGRRHGRTGSLTQCTMAKWSRCEPTGNVLVALSRPLRCGALCSSESLVDGGACRAAIKADWNGLPRSTPLALAHA